MGAQMGVRLMVEVLDHAPASWTQTERLIVIAIAEHASDNTRRGYPGIELIAHRAGVDVDSVSRTLRRMAKKGTELRVAAGTDKTGRVIYAHRSHRTVYEIPKLCPEDEHRTNVCLQRADSGPVFADTQTENGGPGGDPVTPERPDGGPGSGGDESPESAHQRADEGPGYSQERPDDGPPAEGERPDGGPERPDGGPERPDGGPALPLNSLSTPQGGVGGGDPKPPAPARARATQPSLISLAAVRLSQSEQTILDSLRWQAGRGDVTEAEAKAVTKLVRRRLGSKTTLRYLQTMGGPDGGGFSDFLDEVRLQRQKRVADEVAKIRASEPPCEHGAPGGKALHPTTKAPLCPLCRTGRTTNADNGPTTDPDIAAALTAYWGAYAGKPETGWLVQITQQITALRVRGATRDQLIALARRAGSSRKGLIHAAQEGAA